jgi:hypothetical protein
MLEKVLLAAATVMLVEVPISASAEVCEGILSWLCSNAESTAKRRPEEAPQRHATATRYSGNETKKPAGSARSRDFQETASADPTIGFEADCLSRDQVRGGYRRYRVIHGRHCWYASARTRQTKLKEINVDPYKDPIWEDSHTAGFDLADCEVQALKLDAEEKQTFMKECVSNNVR